MGFRLNVEITANGKVLANAYYHWSGYTMTALEITQAVLDNLSQASYQDDVINAVKLLETTEAALPEEEKDYLQKNVSGADKVSFKDAVNRNKGLIAVSQKGIDETRLWEDDRVTIDIQLQTINFQAVAQYDSKKEYVNARKEKGLSPFCKYIDIDFTKIPFDKFEEVKNFIENLPEEGVYGFETPDGKFWGLMDERF